MNYTIIIERGKLAKEILDSFEQFQKEARNSDDWKHVLEEFHDFIDDVTRLEDVNITSHVGIFRTGGEIFLVGANKTVYQEGLTDERLNHLLKNYYGPLCRSLEQTLQGVVFAGECAQFALEREAREAAE